ncbi:MAG: hypothetical protein D6828_03670 [Nitrospirae bacterium]|nr:MAG: hypothetical protein D6828_03670 [Nitrospirota bacterium]
MPGFDRTGPFGTGPIGRGLGPCGLGRGRARYREFPWRGRMCRYPFGGGWRFSRWLSYDKEAEAQYLEEELKEVEIIKKNIEKRLSELKGESRRESS